MKLIKETKSIDPTTGEVVPARVFRENGFVFMEKGGRHVLVERDAELYALITRYSYEKSAVHHLVIEPTYKCNLTCPFCFTNGQNDDFSLDELKGIVRHYRNKVVSISGGEPTLRQDLPEIIKVVNEKNIPLLATNSFKLTSSAYVQELKEAGLNFVTFSLNGFTEKSLIGTTGVARIDERLRALGNIEKAGMQCLISFLLVKGLNEHEIPSLFDYVRTYPHCIREIRIRSASEVGKHRKVKQYFTSEILKLVCQQLHISKEDVMKELRFKRGLMARIPWFKFSMRSCSLSFHLLRTQKGYLPLGRFLSTEASKASASGFFKNLKGLLLMMSPLQLFINRLNSSRKCIWLHHLRVLKVVIRSWPSHDSLDLLDNGEICGSRYILGGKAGKAVCYANILWDIKHKSKKGSKSQFGN